MLTEIRRAESYDLTTLSVALRQLRNLALTSRRRLRTRGRCEQHPAHNRPWDRSVAWTVHAAPALSLRSVADGYLPRRWGAHGAVQLGAGEAAGRHVRAAHRGHRRGAQPPGVDEGIIDALAWLGIARRRATFEGPYFQSSYAAAHVAAAERLYEQGLRLLLRPDARADRGARQGARASPATTASPATAGSGRAPGGCCASAFPTA